MDVGRCCGAGMGRVEQGRVRKGMGREKGRG